jgi:hypothetical protein
MRELREKDAVAAYIRSYEECPETQEEREWAEMGAAMAAEVWPKEDWSKDYEEFVAAEEESLKRERATR